MFKSHRTVGRAKPPARHFDVAQVLRGVPAVRLSAGNGASFSAFRQRTRVRLLPALRFGAGGTCCSAPIPTFASYRGTLFCERRNQGSTGKPMIPARLLNLKFLR